MSKLEDFLSLGKTTDKRDVIEVSVFGKKLSLTIRPMSEEEHNEWQKRAMTISRKGDTSFSLGKYNSLMVPACVVEPNFNDADFLEKAKCISGWEFINSRFPAGVIEDIASRIQKLSGFNTLQAEVEEAKN